MLLIEEPLQNWSEPCVWAIREVDPSFSEDSPRLPDGLSPDLVCMYICIYIYVYIHGRVNSPLSVLGCFVDRLREPKGLSRKEDPVSMQRKQPEAAYRQVTSRNTAAASSPLGDSYAPAGSTMVYVHM